MKCAPCLILTALVLVVSGIKADQHESKPAIIGISLERSECLGPCPAYSITLHPDRTITYVGEAHVKRIGTWTGTGEASDFVHTAELIRTSHFDQFKATYGDIPHDVQVTTTSVVISGEEQTVEEADDRSIPTGLWAIELVIEAQANRVTDWKKTRVPKK